VLLQGSRQGLDVREGLVIRGLELERQSVVQHRLGQSPASLVVAGPLLVTDDELVELVLDLRGATLHGLVVEAVRFHLTPDLEGAEPVSIAIAPLPELEGGGAAEGQHAEQQRRGDGEETAHGPAAAALADSMPLVAGEKSTE
jgi:hypothetical protein